MGDAVMKNGTPAPLMPLRVRAVYADLPVVDGGLISNMKEVETLLEQGLSAVSTSHPEI
jgi:glycerol-3-phosphate responsive antiterminator